ncbi:MULTISPECIES: RES domain-containing protein [Streptomyces]|uniref:RES domain-containing protein n=2 Tax=Streptomyces TaxID=1883 RepID=A0ABU3UPK5_9ACTN|nr:MULTISPECIES: RES domain-containing protein [Streptomyces]MDU8995860.1 RES domain-containing protein [Streptomyces mirabilis]NMI59701.1 RES domain-containing protein [Streptomyces sp. RLA2-12]QDN63729.1 RES domain-containing protein [Streptomyces sp. S1D4-20]QDN73771.1 RES domain-containing protein [Streptomyces sp. S1D4-14]QDO04470.1 RES domain-containing protein [Streptomyces sp. RLB1-9]
MNNSPSAVTTAHLPSLVPAPERGVWRLGKRDHPKEYNRLEPETSQGSSAGRFSLATYGTLYCASDPAGCYAEALAPFRVHPKLRGLIGHEWDERPSHMRLGHLASGWREDHILVRLEPAKDAQFLDVDAEATRAVLARELRGELAAWDIEPPLTDPHIHGRDRRLARQIAAWTVAQRNDAGHRLAQGIAYRSGYGGRTCWAIFHDVDLVEAERRPIQPESPELRAVAAEYGLRVF